MEKDSYIPSYDELLKAAQAMHAWIFLHSGNEELAYKACRLSDEMNAFLGYFGSSSFTVPADEAAAFLNGREGVIFWKNN